jgi:hypothetical protein
MPTFEAAARRAVRVAAMALGWRPSEFWSATPADLRNALGLDVADDAAPATGAMLARLMEAYPDEH